MNWIFYIGAGIVYILIVIRANSPRKNETYIDACAVGGALIVAWFVVVIIISILTGW